MKEAFPIRLKNARKMRGLSLRQLSKAMGGEVSVNALNKYENGVMKPSPRVLAKLASALGVHTEELFAPIAIHIDLTGVTFRKRESLRKREAEVLNCRIAQKLEKMIEVENLSREAKTFTANRLDISMKDISDTIAIAKRFRQDYSLGDCPIASVAELLWRIGAKVVEVDASESFEVNSFVHDGTPILSVNKNLSPEHKRYLLLCEISHYLLTSQSCIQADKLSEVFAREVLLPTNILIEKLGERRRSLSLVELKSIQRQYGISVEDIMLQAKQADIISHAKYLSFCKLKISSIQFREETERSNYPYECSQWFERLVFKLLANGVITTDNGATLLGVPPQEIENHLCLL